MRVDDPSLHYGWPTNVPLGTRGTIGGGGALSGVHRTRTTSSDTRPSGVQCYSLRMLGVEEKVLTKWGLLD